MSLRASTRSRTVSKTDTRSLPKLSRRCAVMSTRRFSGSRPTRISAMGSSRVTSTAQRRASMTVLPVTTIAVGATPSANRFDACRPRGGQVQIGGRARDHTVELLGERSSAIAGTEPGFEVRHPHPCVGAGDRGRHDRGRVTLDDEGRRVHLAQRRLDAEHHPRRHLGRRLVRLHQVEVDVHRDVEGFEGRGHELTVLACRQDHMGHVGAAPAHGPPEPS